MSEMILMDSQDATRAETAYLTPEERARVDKLAKKINFHDTRFITSYGSEIQSNAAAISDSALKNISGREINMVSSLLIDIGVQINDFSCEAASSGITGKKGLFGRVRKRKVDTEKLHKSYDSAVANLDRIAKDLVNHQMVLRKDIIMLNSLYDENLKRYKELSVYIAAGKQAIETCKYGQLQELSKKAKKSDSSALAVKDLQGRLTQFEKQIYNLELTQTVCLQMAPQIRIVQNTDSEIVRTIDTCIMNALPLWKSQMMMALDEQDSRDTLEAQKTLRQANANLVSAVNAMADIQKECRDQRAVAEKELKNIVSGT